MATIPEKVFALPRPETDPSACSRFNRCGAPLCPLDAGWRLRRDLDREPVCAYLREAAKPSGKASLAYTLLGYQAEAISKAAPQIAASSVYVRRVLERAALCGSKIAAGQRLQDMRP